MLRTCWIFQPSLCPWLPGPGEEVVEEEREKEVIKGGCGSNRLQKEGRRKGMREWKGGGRG